MCYDQMGGFESVTLTLVCRPHGAVEASLIYGLQGMDKEKLKVRIPEIVQIDKASSLCKWTYHSCMKCGTLTKETQRESKNFCKWINEKV